MKEITSASTILDLISNTPIQGLLILSLFILPAILASWVYLMNQLKIKPKIKLYVAIFIIFAYVLGVIFIKNRTSEIQELKDAENKIVDYMQAKHFKIVGFNEARDRVDGISKYDDSFLIKLAYSSPELVLLDDLISQKPYFDSLGFRFKDYNQQNEKYDLAITEIKNYLLAKNKFFIGYKAIQENINAKYKKKFLDELVDYSPDLVPTKLIPIKNSDQDTIGLEVIKFKNEPTTKHSRQ